MLLECYNNKKSLSSISQKCFYAWILPLPEAASTMHMADQAKQEDRHRNSVEHLVSFQKKIPIMQTINLQHNKVGNRHTFITDKKRNI